VLPSEGITVRSIVKRLAITVLVTGMLAACAGGTPTAAPASTTNAASTQEAAAGEPSPVALGIQTWTPYTSKVYGITFGYPDGWRLESAATRKWQEGDELDERSGFSTSESFMNPDSIDGDEIALGVWQQPAGSGDDITSREGLAAWFKAHICDDGIDACETVPHVALPMCLGREACLPALLVPLSDSTQAVVADAETGQVTIVSLGRPNDFPAAARYGGAVRLLKSILTTMDVWTPEPGQVPAGG
jgi:hypothetical protein